jgi:hypothetical protein
MIACPSLSHDRRVDRYFEQGQTIAECLTQIAWQHTPERARVFIDGRLIPAGEWEHAVPQAGQAVVVRSVPAGGGGGGGGGKEIIRIIGFLAIAASAVFTAGGSLGALLPEALAMGLAAGTTAAKIAAGVIAIGGTLALNALIPPARPRLSDLSGQTNDSSALALTGSSNALAPYARIPRVYGTHRMYPPLAAKPYTELEGNKQFIRMLFCFGYGPVSITDIRIGETLLSQFTNYRHEFRSGDINDTPITLFPNDVEEESLSVKLTQTASWIQKTSAANARELTVEFTFPGGLTFYDPNQRGKAVETTVSLDVEFKETTASTWMSATLQPAVHASVTTQFAGSNNDLVFTMKATGSAPGALGNAFTLHFNQGPLSVSYMTGIVYVRGTPTNQNYYSINITALENVTTAAQIKAAVEANTTLNALVSVSFPGAETGTGAIDMRYHNFTERGGNVAYDLYAFSGGKNVTSSATYTANTGTLVRRSIQWIPPTPGVSYDVRVRRTTVDHSQVEYRDEVYWTMFRTVQTTSPAAKKGVSFYALRIQATDQLNGTVDQLSALVTSHLLDWTGTEWTVRPTNNPASVYRDVMQGRANRRPKSDAQMDLATIQAFHTRCAAQGFQFNAVIDFQTTVKQLRQDVLAVGRATFGMRDMKYSVVEDLIQATPVDIITPRTSWGFKWTRRFVEMPHAFKVRFISENLDFKQDEQFVYADGYNASNATVFEETDAGLGVTNFQQMYTLKRRELADALLRSDDYEVSMDFSHINFTRGDRVQLQHDVILAGLVSARIKTVTLNGSSQATAISFDDAFTMGAGVNYGARFRRTDGVQVVSQVVTVAGEVVNVTFTTPIAAGLVPAVGDLVTFGELGKETIDCIVRTIEPGPDYTATIKLQDYAPAIQTAEAGTIPAYNPQITLPLEVITPVPQIVQVVSNEDVLVRNIDGSLQSRIVVSTFFPSGFRLPLTKLETQFRITDSDDDWKSIFTNISGMSVEVPIEPVQDGESYDIRLRTLDTQSSLTSAWATISGHVVVGKTSPPPDVPTLVIEGDRLRWDYPNPPPDLAGFLVRFRAGNLRQWEDATEAHSQIILTTDFQILSQQGQQTWMVKAVDVAGNESLNPATVVFNLGDQLLDNVVVTVDHKALGFPGTKTNCSVVSTNLEANSSSPFWGPDLSLFWSTDGASLFWGGLFSTMTYEWAYGPALDLLDASLKLDWTISGNYIVEYRTDSSALMWNADSVTPMWNASAATLMWSPKGDYIAWPGVLSPLTYQQYEFRITGFGGTEQVVVEQLKIILDVPDILEVFPDVLVGAAGTRLAIAQTYRNIVAVQLTLQDDGGTAAYVKTMDKDLTLGPLIQAFTTADVATAGLVDATVQGY